jgi:hypothetical protein
MTNIPFQTTDWTNIEKTKHKGYTGYAIWQTKIFDNIRVRLVEYSENYEADHWCSKGHIVYCLAGEFISKLDNNISFTLTQGMCYIVSDDLSAHKSFSQNGVKLLIIDGAFLASK